MKAIIARKKYFEDYIVFEHLIKILLQIKYDIKYKESQTAGTAVGLFIKLEKNINQDFKYQLWNHVNNRNILAHRYSSYQIKNSNINKMKKIKKFNIYLESLI